MNSLKFIILPISCLLAVSCTTTTVVLLPDSDGNVGQVDMVTDGGKTVLNNAFESAEAKKQNQPPTPNVILTNEKIQDTYGEILAREPMIPDHFRFYFKPGKSGLLEGAQEMLIKAKERIQERQSCDISVIGYADRVENDDLNYLLSSVRAQNVAHALINKGVSENCMDIRYYGENYPFIPTPDEVDEPRNRRVEIEIR